MQAAPQPSEPAPQPSEPAPCWSELKSRPRAISRRNGFRLYLLERLSNDESRARRREQLPEVVQTLATAGKTGSALRRHLKLQEIDPKLARLVLLFYGRQQHRVADVAWMLGVSPSTASRLLDRAEHGGLVDKLYRPVDRRGTWARLTTRGVELRKRVEHALATMPTNERPRGIAYGQRASPPWDE